MAQRVRFQQFSEKKAWQGIDVRFCGIPGGLGAEATLLPEEEQHRKESAAAVEALRHFHISSLGRRVDGDSRNKAFGGGQPLSDRDLAEKPAFEDYLTNEAFINFKFFELLQNDGAESAEIDKNMIRLLHQLDSAKTGR